MSIAFWMSALAVSLVILGMRANPFYNHDAGLVSTGNLQSALIAFHIEDDSIASQKAGGGIPILDVRGFCPCRRAPGVVHQELVCRSRRLATNDSEETRKLIASESMSRMARSSKASPRAKRCIAAISLPSSMAERLRFTQDIEHFYSVPSLERIKIEMRAGRFTQRLAPVAGYVAIEGTR
ncbi:MAG: hypothetical protein WBE91_01595 [Steroidobacteraceae bacterium]